MAIRVIQILEVWSQRSRQRRAMRDHFRCANAQRIERDIGVAPGTLVREAYKPFWQE